MKAKIKIMNAPLRVSDEEIRSLMDFDTLLKRKDELLRDRKAVRTRKYLLAALACLVVAVLPTYFLKDKNAPNASVVDSRPDSAKSENATQVPMAVEDTPPSEKAFKKSLQKRDPASPPLKDSATAKALGQQKPSEPPSSREAGATHDVYVQAEPLDGYPALYSYFATNLVYPPEAVKDSVEGIVNVAFVLDTDGRATNITVEKSLGPLFDAEVSRLLNGMPAWKPATYNGIPVRSKISLPIKFEIQTSNR